MSDLKAEEFYNNINHVDQPCFTKLDDYFETVSNIESIFEFTEAYFDARIQANGYGKITKQALPINSVMNWAFDRPKKHGRYLVYDNMGWYGMRSFNNGKWEDEHRVKVLAWKAIILPCLQRHE